jgi:hypothetical protein
MRLPPRPGAIQLVSLQYDGSSVALFRFLSAALEGACRGKSVERGAVATEPPEIT